MEGQSIKCLVDSLRTLDLILFKILIYLRAVYYLLA